MPEGFDASRVEAEVAALHALDLPGLKAAWSARWGRAPKLRSADLLRRMIAWRIQVEAFGGPSAALRAKARGNHVPRTSLPPVGTRLTREYRGVLHTAEIGDGEVLYQGRSYPNLTRLAEAITGTHWNGPKFFGLRNGLRP